jgi:class 3 adenylate cyclase
MPEHGMSVRPAVSAPPEPVVQHREVLRSAIFQVEDALAAPSYSRAMAWCASVAAATHTMEAAFAEHVHLTEQPEGLYDELRTLAPHLDGRLTRLQGDHVEIMSRLTGFLNSVDGSVANATLVDEERIDAWRIEGTQLLGLLVRHRQRGIDLTFEAYLVDTGGE